MLKRNIGKNTIGSGNKMTVMLNEWDRSTHNIGSIFKTTMSAGTLVPFLKLLALPGDTFDIELDVRVMTHPTVGPLFDSYKVQLDVFQAPIRLYQAMMHNNMLNIGMDMSQVKLPVYKMEAFPMEEITTENQDINFIQINPSSIFAYLGHKGIGIPDPNTQRARDFNAVALICYYDICKNYYFNKQEDKGAIIHTPPVAINENIGAIDVNGTLIPQNVGTPIPPNRS